MPKQTIVKRAYAVIDKSGKLVIQENNHLHPLLVFDKKYLALGATWAEGEHVERVSIVLEERR